jgi:amicyanin
MMPRPNGTSRTVSIAIAISLLVAFSIASQLAGAAPGDPQAGPSATGPAVRIVNYAFDPPEITIAVGDTVTWTNEDDVQHTATALQSAFDSGLLANGASFSFTFTEAGAYDYRCTPHPFMTGRVIVE